MKKDEQISTYEKVLSIARKLFLEKGYEQTSIQTIITELGISKGGIYHHFKSKDEILSAIIQSEMLPLVSGAESIFAKEGVSPEKKLLAWMQLKTEFYRDKFSLLRQVFVGKSDVWLRFRIIDEMKKGIKPIIEKMIEQETTTFPYLKETVHLSLCSHELVFSYGLSEIQNEEEFEKYLLAINHIFSRVFTHHEK